MIDVDFADNDVGAAKLLFSTRSTKFKVIDSTTWGNIANNCIEDVPQNIIQDLIESKILVNIDADELSEVLQENKDFIAKSDQYYMVIQPTAACPFGCHYCGQLHSPKGLSQDHQDGIVNRITKELGRKKFNSMFISWFGAEPISGMKIIDDLSPRIQQIAKDNKIPYGANIVTNGLLLSPEIAKRLIFDYDVRKIEITLDGDKQYHDVRRHLKNGGETFDKIYANILELVKIAPKGVHVSLRSNIDERNKDGVEPLLKRLAADGLQDKVTIYFAPIHSWGNDAHKLSAEKNDFAQWEIEWFLLMEELGFKNSYLPARKKSACMALDPNSELVDPFGQTFGCTEVSLVPFYEKNGKNIHQLDMVTDDKNIDSLNAKRPFLKFYDKATLSQYECHVCPMLPTCGGACPKEWSEGRMPCPSTKFNIREKMLLEYINIKKNNNNDLNGIS